MDAAEFAAAISFRIMKPGVPAPQGLSELQTMFARAGLPLDVMNTVLPESDEALRRITTELSDLPGRSTFATTAVIQRAVQDSAHLGVAVCWGSTMAFVHLCLHAGQKHKSTWVHESDHGLEAQRAMQKLAAPPALSMSLPEWLEDTSESIGVLTLGNARDEIDASALDSAVSAAPKMPRGGWIVLEGGNSPSRRECAAKLVAKKLFKIRFDGQTTAPEHPTWGNGMILLQRI